MLREIIINKMQHIVKQHVHLLMMTYHIGQQQISIQQQDIQKEMLKKKQLHMEHKMEEQEDY